MHWEWLWGLLHHKAVLKTSLVILFVHPNSFILIWPNLTIIFVYIIIAKFNKIDLYYFHD